MYKILIIDDDVMIRNGIKNGVKWEELGIGEAMTAKTGIEGEELFRKHLPDIVLTDIRMPKMDGLELLRRVKSIRSDAVVIILSGYDDFSYAQTAIKHGAFDYLLKTAGILQLTEVIRKALEEVRAGSERKEFYAKIRRQLNVSLPLLKYRYLNELLFGFTSAERVLNRLEFAEINIRPGEFALGVIEIDELPLLCEDRDEEERLLLKFSVMNIVEELVQGRGICFESKYEECVVLYYFDDALTAQQNKADFNSVCEEIARNIRQHLKITVSMGLSNGDSGLERVRTCYEDAKKALGHKLFLGKGSIIHIDEVSDCAAGSFTLEIEDERVIISSLRVGDRKRLFETIDGMFLRIGQCGYLRNEDFYKALIELVALASRVLSEYGIELKEALGKELAYYDEIKKYKTFEEAKKWVLSVFEAIAATILNTRVLKAKKIIETAVQYIDAHFNEAVTLEKIAEKVYVSPNYLSRLFSNEMGRSFMEYLTDRRMEKAKLMLGEQDAKASEVGEKVGYDNPHYFSRIFKKHTGMSPLAYKESLKK